jgi:hypothetical protein
MNNTNGTLSWSQLTRWRGECYQRFGSIDKLPIRTIGDVISELLKPDGHVLDVGAGVHKPFKQTVNQPAQKYFSLDSDPEGDFDYHSFDEIADNIKFDLMVANQLLEHLTIADGFDLLSAAGIHLNEGGYFFATVPNMAHPVRYWADASHLTSWPLNDLYGIFRSTGFQVPIMARYNKYELPRNPIKRYVVSTVCEVFRVDWCDSLMIVGQKQG